MAQRSRAGAAVWLEEEMSRHGGGGIGEHAWPPHFAVANVAADGPADAGEVASLAAADKRRLELANPQILEVAKRPARLQETLEHPEYLAHLLRREVLQRQAGDDEIVGGFSRQFLHGRIDERDLIPATREGLFVVETFLQ